MSTDRPWEPIVRSLLLATFQVEGWEDITVRASDSSPSSGGDIWLGDTAIVITSLLSLADIGRCSSVVSDGMRCILITRDERVLGSLQLIEGAGLPGVEVAGAAQFAAQLVEGLAAFDSVRGVEIVAEIASRIGTGQ